MANPNEVKIEWAKDYFGPNAEMAVKNDNVAQLCYYYRWIKESIREAKRKGVGDTRLSDDKYLMLYEKDIAQNLYNVPDLKLYCMEKAAIEMKSVGYINSFKLTATCWYVKKTWPRSPRYQGIIEHHGQWIQCELPITYLAFLECKQLLYCYNSYKDLNICAYKNLKDFNNPTYYLGHSKDYIPPFSSSELLQSQEKRANMAIAKVIAVFACIILLAIISTKI